MSCHSRGRQHAEDTPLRKSVSAKGIWLSIDHSSYYGEVNISGFWPFDTGYLPTLSGFVGSCNLRGYTNVTCSFRDWVSRFPQISMWNFRLQAGFNLTKALSGGICPKAEGTFRR